MFVAMLVVGMVIFVIAKLKYADAILSIHNHPTIIVTNNLLLGFHSSTQQKTMETRKNEPSAHTYAQHSQITWNNSRQSTAVSLECAILFADRYAPYHTQIHAFIHPLQFNQSRY